MGFFERLNKSSSKTPSKVSVGKFKFQKHGMAPETDHKGRVVVNIHPGSKLILTVDLEGASKPALRHLLGRAQSPEQIKGRGVRVRLIVDGERSPVSVETPKGDFVGMVSKGSMTLAKQVSAALSSQIKTIAPEIDSLVFGVSALATGIYEDVIDHKGKVAQMPNVSSLEIRMNDPAGLDILPQKVRE